jgi:hypothetical protein
LIWFFLVMACGILRRAWPGHRGDTHGPTRLDIGGDTHGIFGGGADFLQEAVIFDEPELEAILDDLGALENEAALTGTEK